MMLPQSDPMLEQVCAIDVDCELSAARACHEMAGSVTNSVLKHMVYGLNFVDPWIPEPFTSKIL